MCFFFQELILFQLYFVCFIFYILINYLKCDYRSKKSIKAITVISINKFILCNNYFICIMLKNMMYRIIDHLKKIRKNIFLQCTILKIYIQSYVSTHHNNLSIVYHIYINSLYTNIEDRI